MIAVYPFDLQPADSTARVEAAVPVAVVDVDGGLREVDHPPTSQDASLTDGWVESCEVEAPLRAATSDLRTGAVSGRRAATGARTSGAEVRNGLVRVPPSEVAASAVR